MSKTKHNKMLIRGTEVGVSRVEEEDYILLTDMIKAKDGDFFISDWLRNRNTVEYPSIWERIHNPDFNYGEFAIIKSQAGLERPERLKKLYRAAIRQIEILIADSGVKQIGDPE